MCWWDVKPYSISIILNIYCILHSWLINWHYFRADLVSEEWIGGPQNSQLHLQASHGPAAFTHGALVQVMSQPTHGLAWNVYWYVCPSGRPHRQTPSTTLIMSRLCMRRLHAPPLRTRPNSHHQTLAIFYWTSVPSTVGLIYIADIYPILSFENIGYFRKYHNIFKPW